VHGVWQQAKHALKHILDEVIAWRSWITSIGARGHDENLGVMYESIEFMSKYVLHKLL
jgi:hypothetical protein